MRHIDGVVCGAVAVREDGARLGKGGGFSDLEFAIARSLGLIDESTPVMTTVHELQVLTEAIPMLDHDVALTHFATPGRVVECGRRRRQPAGVHAGLLKEEQRTGIPLLARLLARLPGQEPGEVGRPN
jgi:5-formyltetrahydrofolate cyclo-ligase